MNRQADTADPQQGARARAANPAAAQGAPDAPALIAALQALRRAPRADAGYWDRYCALIGPLCRAGAALLVQREDGAGGGWCLLGAHGTGDDWALRNWGALLEQRGDERLDKGFALSPLHDDAGRLRILALVQTSGIGEARLVLEIAERERGQLNELIMRAMLMTDFPAQEEPAAMAASAPGPTGAPADGPGPASVAMLDLVAQVVAERRFGAATLVLVNGLAARFGAAQVALGWRINGAMRTVALSHVDRFETNTEHVQLLDEVFLEALGRPAPLWFDAAAPVEEAACRAHARLARLLGFSRVYSRPVQQADGSAGAVLLFGFKERREAPDDADLALATGFLQPWLHELQQRDRWWGLRLRDWARARLALLLGPRQVWRRGAVAACSLLLLYAVFGTWEHRIEANAQLTTDSTRLISAQFDGRVEQVHASAGDTVRAGALLATLDTRELRQQQLDLGAERQRLEAESDKARAAGNLAELGIASARAAQAEARQTRVAQYLAQAQARAPFDGVVVAGERKDLLNAPVKKGDNLFRIARVDGLYVEIMVPERDVRHVLANARGQLRLLSRPDQTFPFTLSAVIPMAQVKGQEGNHFLVKGRLHHAPEAWWRPGMSGIAQVDCGRRNVMWILTHRLLDSLRMHMWWLG
ncbi:MAG: efflux RND transporter periplasmic adaptor subunit [Pseudomonadota bacterium]